ncbi:MAG: lipase secretion chaperone [Aestuariibacter sp.]
MRVLVFITLTVSVTLLMWFLQNGDDSAVVIPEVPAIDSLPLAPVTESIEANLNKREEIAAQRDFVLYSGLKEHFDGFIAKHEGADISDLIAAYSDYLMSEGYANAAHNYGLDLFQRYVHYKAALQPVDSGPTQPQTADIKELLAIQYRLQELQDLRAQYFSQEEYQYLFADDEKFDDAALARLHIVSDKNLSKAQKQALLESHFASLPEAQKSGFQPSFDAAKLVDLMTQSESKSHLYNNVAAEFGDEVAQRFVANKEKQDGWRNKVREFLQQQNSIANNPNLSPQDKLQKLQNLKSDMFSANEMRRLQVYIENPGLLDENG